MNPGVRSLKLCVAAAILTAAAIFALTLRASASPVEFCPAEVSDFAPTGADTYGFQLSAASPRRVTGSLAIETATGWYRAVFKPQKLGTLYVRFPRQVQAINAWIATAASDDPAWAQHGIVVCPPHARPMLAREKPLPLPPAATPVVVAQKTKPLASTDCATPFAEARVVAGEDQFADVASRGTLGSEAAVEVQLNASGDPVGVILLGVTGGELEYGNDLVHAAKLLKFQPAVAYCTPVPSTYLLHEKVNP